MKIVDRSFRSLVEKELSLGLLTICFLASFALGQYGGGSGTSNDPFLIATAEHLNTIGTRAQDLDKTFRVTAPINLTGVTFNVIGSDPNFPFSGEFDGNCLAISNLTILSSTTNSVGLFGIIDGPTALVQDVILIDPVVNLPVNSSVGALAGRMVEGQVSRCQVTNAQVTGFESIGGLVGSTNVDATISDCQSSGAIVGRDNVGALVGFNLQGGIHRCKAAGTVTSDGDDFATGFGGLIGKNSGVVRNCYTTASVDGKIQNGGLAGSNELPGSVRYCLAVNTVTGITTTGGLFGDHASNDILQCFWDFSVSNIGEMCGQGSTGTGCDNTAGLATAALWDPNTFQNAGWDFVTEDVNGTDDVWKLCRGGEGYPQLWWEQFTLTEGTHVMPEDFVEFEITLNGHQASDDSLSQATGTGTVQLDRSTREITWSIDYTDTSLVNGRDSAQTANFHGPAIPRQSAVSIMEFARATEATPEYDDQLSYGVVNGKLYSLCPVQLTADGMQQLLDELWYATIQTTTQADGEIRGQVLTKNPQTSDLTVTRAVFRAFRDRENPKDNFVIRGELPVTLGIDAYNPDTDVIYASIGTDQFVEFAYAIPRPGSTVSPPANRNGNIRFSGVGDVDADLGRFILSINLSRNNRPGKFTLTGRQIDLGGLESVAANPLVVELRLGDYRGLWQYVEPEDDKLLNGRSQMPLCLLSGVKDAMVIDSRRARVIASPTRGDSLILRAQVSAADPAVNLSAGDVTVRWGSIADPDNFEETLDPAGFTALGGEGSGRWRYRRPRGVDTAQFRVVSMTIDFSRCQAQLNVRSVQEGLVREGTGVFTIEVGNGGSIYSVSDEVTLN